MKPVSSRSVAHAVKHRNFTMLNNRFFTVHLRHLSRSEMGVFLVLQHNPSTDRHTLATLVGCTVREIHRALGRLIELRLLERLGADSYRILLKVEEVTPTSPKSDAPVTPEPSKSDAPVTQVLKTEQTTTRERQKTHPPVPPRQRGAGVPPWRATQERRDMMAAMTFEERIDMFDLTEQEWQEQEQEWEELAAHTTMLNFPNAAAAGLSAEQVHRLTEYVAPEDRAGMSQWDEERWREAAQIVSDRVKQRAATARPN